MTLGSPFLYFRCGLQLSSLLVLIASSCLGCDAVSAQDLPEWSPADHDNQESPAAGQVDTTKRRAGMPDLEKHGINDVVLATWKQNCVRCHGVIGRGDGPDGRMLSPPNLTSAEWQATVSDEQLKGSIKMGKGKMPAFQHLPDETIAGLLRLIRMLAPRDVAPAPEAGQAGPTGAAPAHPTPALPPGHP